MKIGINLLFLKPWLAGGTETYAKGLLQGIAAMQGSEDVYYIFCSSTLDTAFIDNNAKFIVVKFNNVSRSLAYRYFFEQFIFPFRLTKYRLDVLHSLGYIGPVFVKNHLVTIHDANAFAHKNAMPFGKRVLLQLFLKAIAKTCSHIIAVSSFAKQEIIKHLHAKPEKISVVYEACKFSGSHAPSSLPSTFAFLNNTPYFIALASTSTHKNINTLVEAFALLLRKQPQCRLVLVGHMPAGNTIQQCIQSHGIQNNTIITGFVEDAVLQALLSNAYCFVFPSLYEGFGLPMLEAQTAGIPVIASNMGSLPEIGGESAIYFEATNAVELCGKMELLLNSTAARQQLIAKGIENVQRFSWQKAAEETVKLYHYYK